MAALRISIFGVWVLFWIYWLVAAAGAKRSVGTVRNRAPGLVLGIVVVILLRLFRTHTVAVDSLVLQIVGSILFLAGLGVAVWARIYLGGNWGMPMTQRAEPELVTTGPYAYVRHPIYSGILLGILGTSLATNFYWLIALAVMSAYFIYSATVEERRLANTFPTTYPSYRERTKMLIPFVL